MESAQFDNYTSIFEYFALAGDSLIQADCDAISDELNNWMGGDWPCIAVLKNGRIEVSIGHFSPDSGFGLGTDLFVHLSRTALRKCDKSVAYNFVQTRENV